MRGATVGQDLVLQGHEISIHAPHAGRDDLYIVVAAGLVISIHAPHAGRDDVFCVRPIVEGISIHAPHAGRDLSPVCQPPEYW